MKQLSDQILNEALEIEALALLLAASADNADKCASIKVLINEHTARLSAILNPQTEEVDSTETAEGIAVPSMPCETVAKTVEAASEEAEEEEVAVEEAEVENEVVEDGAESIEETVEEPANEAVEETADEVVEEAVEEVVEESAEETVEKVIEGPIEETTEETAEEAVEEVVEEAVDNIEEEAADEPATLVSQQSSTPSDINTSTFARITAGNVRSAFSINDNYRFRRELFGNSRPDFEAALDCIDCMQSPDEAYEYFIKQLQWEATNDDVKDFLDIVTAHLSGKVK